MYNIERRVHDTNKWRSGIGVWVEGSKTLSSSRCFACQGLGFYQLVLYALEEIAWLCYRLFEIGDQSREFV